MSVSLFLALRLPFPVLIVLDFGNPVDTRTLGKQNLFYRVGSHFTFGLVRWNLLILCRVVVILLSGWTSTCRNVRLLNLDFGNLLEAEDD